MKAASKISTDPSKRESIRKPLTYSSLIFGTTAFKWLKGEVIGRGTFGKVYLGMNVTNGEMMAIKKINIPLMVTQEAEKLQEKRVDSLIKAYKTNLGLDHDNLVQYLGHELSSERLFMSVCELDIEI